MTRTLLLSENHTGPELPPFATWFGEDWELLYPTFDDGARMYFEALSPRRRDLLARELQEFLEANRDRSDEDIENAWIRQGGGAAREDGVRPMLQDFLARLRRYRVR